MQIIMNKISLESLKNFQSDAFTLVIKFFVQKDLPLRKKNNPHLYIASTSLLSSLGKLGAEGKADLSSCSTFSLKASIFRISIRLDIFIITIAMIIGKF